jgi:hypothetical protein
MLHLVWQQLVELQPAAQAIGYQFLRIERLDFIH